MKKLTCLVTALLGMSTTGCVPILAGIVKYPSCPMNPAKIYVDVTTIPNSDHILSGLVCKSKKQKLVERNQSAINEIKAQGFFYWQFNQTTKKWEMRSP